MRYIIFAIVWGASMGRHHFWLLPNLTEECGFLESFKPLYTHEYHPPSQTEEEKEKEDEKDETGEDKDQKENGPEDQKDDSSEGKEAEAEKEPWVKLTEEEVESARSEAAAEC